MLLSPWDSPGKNPGVGRHFLLQGIFLTQGSNPNLLHWQADPSPLSHQESPQICMYSFGCTGLQHEGYSDVAMWDSFPPPGIEPGPPTLGAQKLTLWTTREDPTQLSVQFSSVAQLCPTLCDPMDCSMPGFPVPHQLPGLTQTHVHRVDDAIQPSHPLSSRSPPAFSLSQHQGLFQ